MGTDIHPYIEAIGQDSFFEVGRISRNYDLFELIAGVRGKNTMFKRRGIPEDMHPTLKGFAGNDDYWAHSWLTLSEVREVLEVAKTWEEHVPLANLFKEYMTEEQCRLLQVDLDNGVIWEKYRTIGELQTVVYLMEHYEKNGYQTRFVFWFDN